MTHSRTNRLIPIASLFLAIAVFCWATAYKLSLYSHSAQPEEDVAKLLSEAERPAKTSSPVIAVPKSKPPVVVPFGDSHAIALPAATQPGQPTARTAPVERPLEIRIPSRNDAGLRAPPPFTL